MGHRQVYTTLLALIFLFGGFSIPMYSLAVAHMNDHIEADELIAAASGLILLYGAAQRSDRSRRASPWVGSERRVCLYSLP